MIKYKLNTILRGRDYTEEFIESLNDTTLQTSFNFDYLSEGIELLRSHAVKGSRMAVLYDVDVDGLSAGTIITNLLTKLAIEPKIYFNSGKIHGLNSTIVEKAISDKIDLLICVDSASNDIAFHGELNSNHIDVLVLDHHEIETKVLPTPHTVIINPKQGTDPVPRDLSGAAVVYYFCNEFAERLNIGRVNKGFEHAAVSLITDYCPMDNLHNRNFVRKFLSQGSYMPMYSSFIYQKLTASTITYSFAPLMNALIRTGSMNLAVDFYTTTNTSYREKIVAIAKERQKLQKEIINELLKCKISGTPKFCICDISSANISHLISSDITSNFTGLLASKIKSVSHKPTLVLLKDSKSTYRGSFRADGKENYKSILSASGFVALGHEQACGLYIDSKDIKSALIKLNAFIKPEKDIIYDVVMETSDIRKYYSEIDEYAEFNELAGSRLPKIRIKLDIPKNQVVVNNEGNYYTVTADGIQIVAFSEPDLDNLVITPSLSGETTKLLIEG